MSSSKSKSLLELAELLHKIKEGYLECVEVDLQTCLTVTWAEFFDLFIDGFERYIKNINQAINGAEKINWPERKSVLELLLKMRDLSVFALKEIRLRRNVKPAMPANSYECSAALEQIYSVIRTTGLLKYLPQLFNWCVSIEAEGRSGSQIGSLTSNGGETTPVKEPQDTGSLTKTEPSGFLSASELAKQYNLPSEALRKRLDNQRKVHKFDAEFFVESQDRGANKPKYLYKVEKVKPIIEKLLKKTSNKRPTEKN